MVNSVTIRGGLIILCLLACVDGMAQNFSQHNWYFGNTSRGIRFSRSDNSPSLITNKNPLGTGGSAVASDPINGNLLFYTDGANVYDITNVAMPQGNGLNANTSANQPVAVTPIPGTPNQYYIFTNTASFTTSGSIFVTTVNMGLSGNEQFPEPVIGNVVTPVNNVTGITGRSEAMIAVPHFNGTDFWLITHQNGTDNYTATLINNSGSFATSTPSNGITGFPISAGNFSYHAATGKIAVSPQTANDNVAILNFNNSTGELTFDRFVANSASTTPQAIYDTEWSTLGRFLYISRADDVLQFDMNPPVAGTSMASVLANNPDRSFGLQMGPDSTIYHLYQSGSSFLLGRISDTDSLAANVIYTPLAFGSALNFNGTQFPAFLPASNLDLTVTFTTQGACQNSPISFYPTVTPAADSLMWEFGDGDRSSEWSPIHTYENAGDFTVSVRAFLNGQMTSASDVVSMRAFTLELTLPQDTTACRCEFPPPVGDACNNGPFSVTLRAQGGNSPQYNWSNGDTGTTLTPDSAGYYYVVATDGFCLAYAGVNVREYDAEDQRANIWYFGEGAGIDFNEPVTAITGPLNTPEGCSVISDRNGFVIFSTDGMRVYDKNDDEVLTRLVNGVPTPIIIPPGIGGDSDATQSALIMPVQGDETLYYIFTTQPVHGSNTYELRYSLYDLKLNGGNGGLVEYNQLLFTRSTERITGNGQWLIAHEYGNNSFRAYPVGIDGIGNPIISSIGSDHLITEQLNGQGYMKLGGPNLLAVAFSSSTSSNFIEIFDFTDSTGMVTNFRRVNLATASAPTSGQVYGIEFSGNKILATVKGATTSFIREVYIDFQGNPVLIPPSTTPSIDEIPAELGAIQTGPDGQVYVAVNNSNFLGTIAVNGDTLQLSTFTPNGFSLAAPSRSKLGLPNFIQSVGSQIQQASILVEGLCLGSPTDFTGSGTDPIDEFLWDFGDGFSATTQIAQHTYSIAGPYTVRLRITNRCGLDTLLTQQITISAPPPSPTFLPVGDQPIVCNGPLTLQALPTNTPGLTYLWSTGETSYSIVVDRQQIVSVTITNAAGCTSSGQLFVVDIKPIIDLGPNRDICQDTPLSNLDAQNIGSTYEWVINDGAVVSTAQRQPVNTATPGLFEYRVTVTDFNNCVAKDSVTYSVNENPNFSLITTNTSSCIVNDGEIDLTILPYITPTTNRFSYLITGPQTEQGVDLTVGATANITGLEAGAYAIRVTDQTSGCTATDVSTINDNAFTIGVITRQNTCDPLILRVNHTATVTPYNFRIINSVTSAVVRSGSSSSLGFFDTPGVPSGTYVIEITSGGCSFSSPPQTFNQNPVVNVNFVTDLCNAPQVTASGGTSYDWSTSPAGSINGVTNSASVTVNPGTWQLIVIASDGVNCPATETIPVTINPPINASFTQSDACANQVQVTATPSGAFSYQWFRSGSATPDFLGNPLTLTSTENNLRLLVTSTQSGCSDDFTQTVDVIGQLTVSLAPTKPCRGNTFTLTAITNVTGATFQWFRNNTLIPGQTSFELNNLTLGGVYKVIATLSGCPAQDQQLVTLWDATPGSLNNHYFICDQPGNPDCSIPGPSSCELHLDAGANFLSYEWYKNGVLDPTNTTRTFIITDLESETATFTVLLENSNGCISRDETIVERECKPRIAAPNAFRPGSTIVDNKTFSVIPTFVSPNDFQVFIFNRWGEMVYQSDKLDFEWDGTYKGNKSQLLPAGTYSYVVKYVGQYRERDGVQELRGGVVLMR